MLPALEMVPAMFAGKNAFTKIMPPWTLDELEALRFHASPEVSPAELAKRYRRWGGNVRYCLSASAWLGDDRLTESINRVDVDTLVKLLRAVEMFGVRRQHEYGN